MGDERMLNVSGTWSKPSRNGNSIIVPSLSNACGAPAASGSSPWSLLVRDCVPVGVG